MSDGFMEQMRQTILNEREKIADHKSLPVSGLELGNKLLKTFGLEGQMVSSITLNCAADDISVVTIRRYVTLDEAAAVNELLKKYKLVENGGEC